MLSLLYWFFHWIEPILVPICFFAAWAIVLTTVWSLWSAARDSAQRARQMHQIPCANCQFFTGDYHLKCTVHPQDALSEAAIGCRDYRPQSQPFVAR